MELILTPFSALLLFLYDFLSSYGLALIAFSLIIKVILFYFSLKGKKSMIQMNLLQGKMQQIQKQYGKDKARYNQEIQKLYEKEHINPMGGCLWSLVPMIVLILLYYIIREPISYLMDVPRDMIETIAEITGVANTGAYPQIYMARAMNDPEVLAAVKTALGDAGAGVFSMNFDFLGIDLSQIPNWKFWTQPMTVTVFPISAEENSAHLAVLLSPFMLSAMIILPKMYYLLKNSLISVYPSEASPSFWNFLFFAIQAINT